MFRKLLTQCGRWSAFFLIALGATWTVTAASAEAADEVVDFAREVRPILSNHCFKCHGPDEATREAGLRLDTAEGAREDLGGYQAILPHQPDESELIERITTSDEYLRMPPPDSGLELTSDQIEVLRKWVKQGGDYDQHWSFLPVRRAAVPSMQEIAATASTAQPNNAAESKSAAQPSAGPLDQFVDRQLAARGMTRSPQADRETLIRRVYLDLLGVLPSPEAVQQFLRDDAPAAYERLVERVLANPHFGEKWGRHWLDQARYADTHGYTVDSPRTMWPYRDWVIQAINEDKPFDRFTIEQLAGDLLPEPSTEQLVATGFHRNTLINQEGGTDAEQFRNEATVDRVNTTGAVWLGLTIGCAQCHTHKFDPLTHREYYQLFAYFNQAADKNSVDPTVAVPTAEQRRRLEELDQQIAAAEAALEAFDRQRDEQPSQASDAADASVEWLVVDDVQPKSAAGATFEPLEDGSFVVSGPNGDEETYTLTFASPIQEISGVRLETLTHPSLPHNGPGRAGNGNFVLNEIALSVDGPEAASGKWLHAVADHSQTNYDVSAAIDNDLSTGWAINGEQLNVDRTAQFALERLQVGGSGLETTPKVTVTLRFGPKPAQYNIGRFRLAVTDAAAGQLGVPDPERARLVAALERVRSAREKAARDIPDAMIMRDREEARETHVLIRGDFLREGEPVEPGTPAFLPGQPVEDEAATRLDLARWLVQPDHPLVARVTVNRTWMRLFGQGLVETENDFGLQGTPPTHPDLLDWLALEFIQNDWSMKHLIRTIVCSATYRQSSVVTAEHRRADPLNKWLARQSRVRVDAEIVRDAMHSASGLLNREIGGPSVYPPQPDGVYAFTQRQASWPTSEGGDRYRRGMYTFFMRSAPHPMLTTFDTPAFNTTCTRRVRSNTPLQSLTMANDQATVEAARALARRLRNASGAEEGDAARIEHAFQVCFSRAPTAEEREALARFLQEQRSQFAEDPQQAAALTGRDVPGDENEAAALADVAATTVLARLLMNLDEFITRE